MGAKSMIFVFTLGFIALSMACSYKEEYFVNDDTCTTEPVDSKIVNRMVENKCIN